MIENKATVLGLMSGSSLDGLDACLCSFTNLNGIWSFKIEEARTLEIPSILKEELRQSSQLSSQDLLALDVKYGSWIGEQIKEIARPSNLISIHGHTVHHEPSKGFSLQIGSAEKIALVTKKPVVSNFRNKDILLGGQGAPLVPMGEKLLFPDFDAFINLGGICNATFNAGENLVAGDIGPFNQVFNHYSNMMGYAMDKGGALSASGNKNEDLIESWKQITFFTKSFPKSLANQWVMDNFFNYRDYEPADILCSFAHFISDEISLVINKNNPRKVFVTGGGAYNDFTMSLLREKCNCEIVIPSDDLVNYKEALIFAILGLLKTNGEINVLSSSTGANCDSSSGTIYQP